MAGLLFAYPSGPTWAAVPAVPLEAPSAEPPAVSTPAPAEPPAASTPAPDGPPAVSTPTPVAPPAVSTPAPVAPPAMSTPAPVAALAPTPPRAAYVTAGLAVASAVLGTVFGVQALGEKRDFDNGDRTTGRVENLEKKALLADMAFGAAITFAVTSAVLWLSAGEESASSERGIAWQRVRSVRADGKRPDEPWTSSPVLLTPVLSSSGPGVAARFAF